MLNSAASARAPSAESPAKGAAQTDQASWLKQGRLLLSSKRHPIDPIAIVTGLLSVALGLASLVLTLLAVATSVIGMAFAAMLNFVALGFAFLTMGLGWRLLPRLLLGTIALIDVALAIIYLIYETGIDAMIVIRIFPETNIPVYAMNPNGSVACALVAAALLLLMARRRFRWQSIVIFLFGSLIISLGLLGFAGHLIGLQTTYGIARFTGITFSVAAGLVLLGTGVLTISWRQSIHVPTERHAWILVIIAVTGVVATTSLWQALILVPNLPIESTEQFRLYLTRTILTFGLLITAALIVALTLVQKFRHLNEELERRVLQQTAELQAANKELEAFSYSVSHDLRAPLRHLSGFAGLLLEESSITLNQTSRHYVDEIRDAADRMRELIDDLLDFSRMSRQDLHTRSVLLNSLVQEVIRELASETAGRNIEWRIGVLPEVKGDPILLKQVFVNLLSNAVKFTRPKSPAIIEVGEAVVKSERAISVRDNGVGFDMRFSQKLFGVFQRLHRADEFEGTGIGLATVQRIIHRHRGQVWAESEIGKGATFYFTIGAVERQQIPGGEQ